MYKYYHDILLPHRPLFRLIRGNMLCRDLVIGTRKLKFVSEHAVFSCLEPNQAAYVT